MKGVVVIVALVIGMFALTNIVNADEIFKATLTGDQEVNPSDLCAKQHLNGILQPFVSGEGVGGRGELDPRAPGPSRAAGRPTGELGRG